MSNHNWCFVIRTTYLAGYQGTTINGFCFMTILWHNKILKTEIKILRIFVIIKHWENSCFTIFYDIDPRFVDDFTILMTFAPRFVLLVYRRTETRPTLSLSEAPGTENSCPDIRSQDQRYVQLEILEILKLENTWNISSFF